MAWYYGEFICGCEGRVNIIGPQKDRDWKKDKAFSKKCPQCYEKYIEEERERANKEALEKSKEMELPNLSGTKKQIAWAVTLRNQFIEKFDLEINKLKESKREWRNLVLDHSEFNKLEIEDIYALFDYIIENKTTSQFYIQNYMRNIFSVIKEFIPIVMKSDSDKIKEKEKRDLMLEASISPCNAKFTGIVEIYENKNSIVLKYEKNDKFREIVKKLGYKWNDGWSKSLGIRTGSTSDRMAEVGNALLSEGFTICIYDKNIREKAINGDFKTENDKWILADSKNKEKINIVWNGRNDKLYSSSRKLPGSKWEDRCVKVNISKYKEILDFANIYGFEISETAIGLLNNYKIKVEQIPVVDNIKKVSTKSQSGIEDILTSSRDVLDDLKEED